MEKDSFNISSTNGIDLWRAELSKEDIEGHSPDGNVSNVLIKIRLPNWAVFSVGYLASILFLTTEKHSSRKISY